MPITELDFEASTGLQSELAATASRISEEEKARLSRFLTPEDYIGINRKHSHFQDLVSVIGRFSKPCKILDIGAGQGLSTVYFSSLGHHVSAIEPSREACEVIDMLAQQFSLPIAVYLGTAETSDQISSDKFDLIIFNSSLHHCDDPILALKNAKNLLKPDGDLYLVNEPILKPFRSKRWYYRRLKTHPVQMGHYGGNEHIYYAWEYRRLLKRSGFTEFETFPTSFISDPRKALRLMLDHNVDGNPVYSNSKVLVHYAWVLLLSKIASRKFLRAIFVRLSLLPVSFRVSLKKVPEKGTHFLLILASLLRNGKYQK